MHPYLSICAIYRDEASYLREWIEFHRLVGVERFFLYDNLSEDDHREVLAPYVSEGIVKSYDWPLFPGQMQAYDHCMSGDGAESRWIAFIDLDEFLFSPTGAPVPDVLREFEHLPGVGVPWAVFGPSGHKTRPSGPVIENYTSRSKAPRTIAWFKSIVDPRRTFRARGPHVLVYKEREDFPGPVPQFVPFDVLRINHYWTKSEAELWRKLATPRAHSGKPSGIPPKRAMNLTSSDNSVFDDTILRYLPALRKALAARE